MIKTAQRVFILLTLVLLGSAHAFAGSDGKIQLSPVEVRATVPGMTASGGYVVIMNHSHIADRLVEVSADFAKKAEIHEMLNDNGVMKMRQRAGGIEIPAHGKVALKPGGLHLMFMGLAQTLNAGDELEVTLTFESGQVITVPATVKRPGEISSDGAHGEMKHGEGHDHSGHDHSGHDHSGQDHSGHGS